MNVQIRRPALDFHISIPDFFKDVVGQMFKRGKRPDHSNFATELIESTMLHAAQPGARGAGGGARGAQGRQSGRGEAARFYQPGMASSSTGGCGFR